MLVYELVELIWCVQVVVAGLLLVDELEELAVGLGDGDELDVVVLVRAEDDAALLAGGLKEPERADEARGDRERSPKRR